MDYSIFTRFWTDLSQRPSGPMGFRFVLQPIMAIAIGARSGIRDAKTGQPYYLWTIFHNPGYRRELLRSGWKDCSRVFFLAIVLDAVFQLIEFKWFYPLETLTIAILLACLPYVLIRGPVNRIYRRIKHPRALHTVDGAGSKPFKPVLIQGGKQNHQENKTEKPGSKDEHAR